MTKRSPSSYRQLATELHRTGEFTAATGYAIKPKKHIYDMNPTDSQYKRMKIFEVDWVVMASTRSSESNLGYDGYENAGQGWSDFKAIGWPGIIESALKGLAGFSHVNDVGATAAHALGKRLFETASHDPSPELAKLQEIDKLYQQGHTVLMMIDSNMLNDIPDTSLGGLQKSHWVVYEGGLKIINGRVFFKVYSWRTDPLTAQYCIYPDPTIKTPINSVLKDFLYKGISQHSFSSNYYGYITSN